MVIIVFGLSLAYFIYLAAPDVTWINTDSDSGIYLWSTSHLGLSHPTGVPLFNVLGYLITIPANNLREAAHYLALMSAVASAITSALLFLITKKLIAPMIFAASGLVVSQSSIIETYAITTMLMVLLYALRNTKWPYVAAAVVGLGFHHLILFAIIPISVWRRRKADAFVAVGLLSYTYLLLATSPPNADWNKESWLTYFLGQNVLLGGISLEDSGIQRLVNFIIIVGGGLGISTILLPRIRDKLLIILVGLPAFYYLTNLAPQTYVYLMPSFAFASIAIARMEIYPLLRKAIVINCLALIAFNVLAYDIGKTLDPSPTSPRHYLTRLGDLPEGSVVYANRRGWEVGISWNIEKDITVLGTNRNVKESGLIPTHISLSTNPNRYWSELVPCSSFPSCYNWWSGINKVDYYSD